MFDEWHCWKNWQRFLKLDCKKREIVFYAESRQYWTHFTALIDYLTQSRQQPICYFTSDKTDPILTLNLPNVYSFYIGEGFVRNLIFRQINTKIMVLTMPDLQNLYLKRSIHPVHYAYIFHSLVSTHRIYNRYAFDHYDSIFCAGPHHIAEIRETEALYQLPDKQLLKHGYGRLDSIMQAANQQTIVKDDNTILIAPSWGKQNILEMCGLTIVERLLGAGFKVILRPHPQSCRYQKKHIDAILSQFAEHPKFTYETDMNDHSSLHQSVLMICDWSGAAMDYAFGLLKPVMFVDVPAKVNNVDFLKHKAPALEAHIRDKVGQVVSLQQIETIESVAKRLIADANTYAKKLEYLRNETVFNVGHSGQAAANHLLNILDSSASKDVVAHQQPKSKQEIQL